MLRIALPNKGRLSDDARALFNDAGLEVRAAGDRALTASLGGEFEAIFVRAQDIPEFVADGAADVGVTGWDLVCESGRNLEERLDLGFGRCRLVVAAKEDAGITRVEDIGADGRPVRVASVFPRVSARFFADRQRPVEVVPVSGAAEIAPHLGIADIVVDLTSTGSTLKTNGLREVETVLGSFENLVATTFDRAEKRTNAAASGLSTTLREAVEEATSRFTSATSDMQQAAAAIREDLARTRDAVTRGTEDLPAQTRQTADTIQRAIGDQIDAIREVSGIVAKSAAGEARRPVEPRPAPRAAAPEPAPRPSVAETGLRGLLQDEPRQPVKPRAEPETNDSYLAGLLRRASEQDYAGSRRPATPERSPNQVIESLNSLAVDIARAIDHDKAVELWGRYLRGEKDVFTHRLYTLRGQRTFDDISAKYRADREFRSVVDNYCDEFERLLRKVAKGDNAARETEKLLTTDNGKVYTMLAHAAGRLS